MATGRMLLKSISESEKLARLRNDTHRLIYLMILPHLDIKGRCKGNPKLIANQLFPMLDKINEKKIESALKDMVECKLVIWYEVDGKQYIDFPDFSKKQPSLRTDREADSVIPPPESGNCRVTAGQLPLEDKSYQDKLYQDKLQREEWFEQFWKLYPKKKSKDVVVVTWHTDSFELTEEKFSTIMDGLRKVIDIDWQHRKTPQERKYIPNPSTWINQKRWKDEVEPYEPTTQYSQPEERTIDEGVV